MSTLLPDHFGRIAAPDEIDQRDRTSTRPNEPTYAFQLSVLGLLERIANAVEMIAAGAQPKTSGSLAQADFASLAGLLPVISASLLDSNFTSRELVKHADDDVQLEQALVGPVGRDAPGTSRARRLGRLLARAEGHEIEGLVVQRLGQSREGVLWKLERV